MTDTIAALATGSGRSAVAIVRISGPRTREVLRGIGAHKLKPRRATLRAVRANNGEVIDQGLVLWFPGPASYTGEDSAELHLHGGVAVIDTVLQTLFDLGVRPAAPGEFTRRAYESGRMDLGQAEAVADLIEAETIAQARQALAQLEGALGRAYQRWRDEILDILSVLEAAVDFPDEEVPEEIEKAARDPIARLLEELERALSDAPRGRRIREGYRIGIVGAPNAGKSTLLNALVGRDAAIVTPIPGATRDVIEQPLVIEGYRVLLADMAGLRQTMDPVEGEGVRRARAWADEADLRLWVVDQAATDDDWRQAADVVRPNDICFVNKSDLPVTPQGEAAAEWAQRIGLQLVHGSLVTEGARPIQDLLAERIVHDLAGSDFPAATRARHVELVTTAREHLRRAHSSLAEPELAADDVRLAARALAMVTGEIGVEEVLGRVFASFCIGK